VRSLPDGISKVLDEYLLQQSEGNEEPIVLPTEQLPFPGQKPDSNRVGELCPECGQATFINEEVAASVILVATASVNIVGGEQLCRNGNTLKSKLMDT